MENTIGREYEIGLLKQYINSPKPEFIAVYGRRRVGKTYLIDQLFRKDFAFSLTGIIDGKKNVQMAALNDAFDYYNISPTKQPQNWMEAFTEIRIFLQQKIESEKKCIMFIDELPCLDYKSSSIIEALGYFWNNWASKQSNFKLIVCGSATSWMVKNIIDSKGGLHNRITHEIHLHPFCLGETREYLKSQNINWDDLSYLQAYMIFGGIPYYLGLLNNKYSLAQNIDNLFFNPEGEMRREFSRLFKTLFSSSEPYIEIIKILAKNSTGMTRDEIAKKLGKKDNGHLSERLEDLKNCDFLRFYNVKVNKISAKNGIYQLTDFFSAFYLKFINKNSVDSHYWGTHLMSSELKTWAGLTFEKVALMHINQIKRKLHIDYISCEYYSCRLSDAQIDLVIERADNIINICEIKYSIDKYLITKPEYEKVLHRIETFSRETKSQKFSIQPIFITTKGLAENMYSQSISFDVTLEDLFEVIT
ncbi:MAG: AAA family ATPase [Bacteroidales bacterium]|nr:AAA family ATPase [Bacteroidales bacterium]